VFTGLVEEVGTIEQSDPEDDGRRLTVGASLVAADLRPGDSVSVNGCCQTVVETGNGQFSVVAVPETLRRTNLGALTAGDAVNLERPVRLMDRLGGHLVQGHVDGVGRVRELREESPGWWLTIEAEPAVLRYVAEKGSIAVDGISLTVAALLPDGLAVAIIPHTYAMTVVRHYHRGSEVNLEVDLLARYLERLREESR